MRGWLIDDNVRVMIELTHLYSILRAFLANEYKYMTTGLIRYMNSQISDRPVDTGILPALSVTTTMLTNYSATPRAPILYRQI